MTRALLNRITGVAVGLSLLATGAGAAHAQLSASHDQPTYRPTNTDPHPAGTPEDATVTWNWNVHNYYATDTSVSWTASAGSFGYWAGGTSFIQANDGKTVVGMLSGTAQPGATYTLTAKMSTAPGTGTGVTLDEFTWDFQGPPDFPMHWPGP